MQRKNKNTINKIWLNTKKQVLRKNEMSEKIHYAVLICFTNQEKLLLSFIMINS